MTTAQVLTIFGSLVVMGITISGVLVVLGRYLQRLEDHGTLLRDHSVRIDSHGNKLAEHHTQIALLKQHTGTE